MDLNNYAAFLNDPNVLPDREMLFKTLRLISPHYYDNWIATWFMYVNAVFNNPLKYRTGLQICDT